MLTMRIHEVRWGCLMPLMERMTKSRGRRRHVWAVLGSSHLALDFHMLLWKGARTLEAQKAAAWG